MQDKGLEKAFRMTAMAEAIRLLKVKYSKTKDRHIAAALLVLAELALDEAFEKEEQRYGG